MYIYIYNNIHVYTSYIAFLVETTLLLIAFFAALQPAGETAGAGFGTSELGRELRRWEVEAVARQQPKGPGLPKLQ